MFGLSWFELGAFIAVVLVLLLIISQHSSRLISVIAKSIAVLLFLLSFLSFSSDKRQSAADQLKAAETSLTASGLSAEQVNALVKLAEAQSEKVEADTVRNMGLILIFGFLFLGPMCRDSLRCATSKGDRDKKI